MTTLQFLEQYSEHGPSERYDPMQRGIRALVDACIDSRHLYGEDDHYLLENFTFTFAMRA